LSIGIVILNEAQRSEESRRLALPSKRSVEAERRPPNYQKVFTLEKTLEGVYPDTSGWPCRMKNLRGHLSYLLAPLDAAAAAI